MEWPRQIDPSMFPKASRRNHDFPTVVSLSGGAVQIVTGNFIVIAGPCAVENEEQLLQTAQVVKAAGAHALRGGAFKPRTSPYSFQGLGIEGLKILGRVRAKSGLPVVSEVLDTRDVSAVAEYADVIQIGSRSSQNYPLLKEVAKVHKPIILKRGMAMTVEEWLYATEYLLSEGNEQVILCERGIRTFEPTVRHTLDLAVVPFLKEITHLPVIVDPSHAVGRASLVPPMVLAAKAAGSDGVMVEVHPNPEKALSDGLQSLTPADFVQMMERLNVPGKKVIHNTPPPSV